MVDCASNNFIDFWTEIESQTDVIVHLKQHNRARAKFL